MLTQPLSGGDDRTRGMIGVSSPTAFPLAIVGDDVTAGQTGVSSSLSTPPHPCAFSSPSSVTPPNSHTPVPLSIHINPPPPPFSVSLSTPPFMLTHSASSLPPISSPPLPPPHSPFFSIFLNPSLLPPPSLSLPPFSPPPLPSTTSHSSSSSSSISILPSPSISPPTLSHFSTPSSSCHLLPSFIHPSPSYLCSSVSSFSLPSFSSPAPPSPHLSVICSPSPSPSVSTTLHPSSPPPPPPPPSCCPCSSLLPRLLSTHQMEVRRILRGALSSLGRRLDFFEKKSRRKRRRRIRQARKDPPAFTCSSSPTSIPPLVSSSSPSPTSFSTSLSLDREDSHTLISKSEQSNSKEGEKKMGARKRRNSQVEVEEEEDAGRFVGQMAVSFTRQGGGAEALLTLHDFNHKRREQGETGQPEKDASVVVRQNGYSSTSHHPLHRLQSAQSGWTSTQSEAACRSFVQWHFSNSILSTSLFSNHRFSHRRLCCFLSFSPTSMLQLSAVSVETVSKLLKGEACESPLWPLKDWTAPPSLSSDHCYVRLLTPSLTFSAKGQRKQRDHHIDQSAHPPQRWPLLLPPCSANGLFAPIPANQSAVESRFLITNAVRSKRVSQIRIRRATPRETPLTPMGLPKIRRLKKKEFSLEEIYTNKNYKSPTTIRSLETIFEEPREKDGAMFLIGQQRRRRLLLFPDFTQPRKRKKPQGAGLPVAVVPRKRTARRHCHGDGSCDDNVDLDVMLVERLSALEDFLTQQGLDF